jgi:hypothetical protein
MLSYVYGPSTAQTRADSHDGVLPACYHRGRAASSRIRVGVKKRLQTQYHPVIWRAVPGPRTHTISVKNLCAERGLGKVATAVSANWYALSSSHVCGTRYGAS